MFKNFFATGVAAVLVIGSLGSSAIGVSASGTSDAKVFRISDYANVGTTADEGIWSVARYNGLNTADWSFQPLTAAQDTNIDVNISDSNDFCGVTFNTFSPDGTYLSIINRDFGAMAVGFTAPYASTWQVKVEADVYKTESFDGTTTFNLGRKNSDTTNVTSLFTQTVAPLSVSSPAVVAHEDTLDLGSGDSLYLMHNDFWPNAFAKLRFVVTDVNNPDVVYDASKVSTNHLMASDGTPSPFNLGLLTSESYVYNDLILNTVNVLPASLNDGTALNTWTGHIYTGTPSNISDDSFFINGENLAISPKNGSRRPVVRFTAPQDGNYTLNYTFSDLDGGDWGGRGYITLYKTGLDGSITGGPSNADYTFTANDNASNVTVSKLFLGLKKGESIMMSTASSNGGATLFSGAFTVERIAGLVVDYSISSGAVENFSQVANATGDTLSVDLSYLYDGALGEMTGVVLICIYNADGKLVSSSVSEKKSLTASAYTNFKATVNIPEGISGGKVQTFLWDDLNNIRPLVEKDILR